MADGRVLQIFRDGRRRRDDQLIQLPDGAQGNYQTLGEMAKIVREDAAYPDLRNFAFDRIIGREADKTLDQQIESAYTFCRDEIKYLPEGEGTETVADLWSCCYGLSIDGPVGDCAVKSVALATCLCYLTVFGKPFFIAVRQLPNVDFFNHVYIGLPKADGTVYVLDPTPPEFRPGQQVDAFQKVHYRIF